MKTPLEHEPFPPVELSFDQKQQLQWLTNAVVEETLAEYDAFVYTHNRHIDKTKWKQAMARENVTIYKRHGKGELGGCTPQVSLAPGGAQLPPYTTYWRIPKVIGVGSIPGTVEELLYGTLAPTKMDSDVRSTYIKDYVVDTRVLASVVTPTEAQPLQSLLVRWSLVVQLIHKICVSPRDMVYIEASGYKTLANGEKIGYFLLHPVEVPGCGSLEHLGAVRCGMPSCFVFRDITDADNQGAGCVEMYMRGFVTPGGTMPDGVATFIACVTLMASHRFMTCGQHKKLAWMVRNQYAMRRQALDAEAGRRRRRTSSDGSACPVCTRSLGGRSLRSPVACDVCAIKVCARCVDKRKLTHVRSSGKIVRVNTKVCKACATVSASLPASVVALSEHVRLLPQTHSQGSNLWQTQNAAYEGSSFSSNLSISSSSNYSFNEYFYRDHSLGGAYPSSASTSSFGSLDSMDAEMAWYDLDGSTRRSSAATITTAVLEEANDETMSSSAHQQHQHQQQQQQQQQRQQYHQFYNQQADQLEMWLRMNKMRVAAEETYMLAKYNAKTMLDAAATQQNQQNQNQQKHHQTTHLQQQQQNQQKQQATRRPSPMQAP